MSAALFDRFLSTAEMTVVFGVTAIVRGTPDFEAALARAIGPGREPRRGGGADRLCLSCRTIRPRHVVSTGAVAGTLAIPLVSQPTALVAADDAQAAGFVHLKIDA